MSSKPWRAWGGRGLPPLPFFFSRSTPAHFSTLGVRYDTKTDTPAMHDEIAAERRIEDDGDGSFVSVGHCLLLQARPQKSPHDPCKAHLTRRPRVLP